ncbi:hypothetical protein BDM02DRAFT_3129487 [Thelephora ganbajun]|uniref:Uncharacterized protein n=1 Tax=Thelephora ganbajun TaxID=370292 RepID=A0ACB6ZE26_THEGA|nr:hypothetical protein BDM02DRAFT_3129487 [Thelephora ganbajun]
MFENILPWSESVLFGRVLKNLSPLEASWVFVHTTHIPDKPPGHISYGEIREGIVTPRPPYGHPGEKTDKRNWSQTLRGKSISTCRSSGLPLPTAGTSGDLDGSGAGLKGVVLVTDEDRPKTDVFLSRLREAGGKLIFVVPVRVGRTRVDAES